MSHWKGYWGIFMSGLRRTWITWYYVKDDGETEFVWSGLKHGLEGRWKGYERHHLSNPDVDKPMTKSKFHFKGNETQCLCFRTHSAFFEIDPTAAPTSRNKAIQTDEHGVSERAGLGKVFKDAIRGLSCRVIHGRKYCCDGMLHRL